MYDYVTSANWKVHVFMESFIRTVFCLDVVIGFQIFRVGPRQRLFVSLVGPSVKTKKKLNQTAIRNTGRTK